MEQDEESELLINPSNKYLNHETGVAATFKGRAGGVFQDESNRLLKSDRIPYLQEM